MRRTIKFAAGTKPEAVPAPAWLGDHGKAKWREVVKAMAEEKPIATLDFDCLAMYCEAHDEVHKARATLERFGRDDCVGPNGALYPHPAVGQKNKAIERIRKFGRELGINRASRKATKPKQVQMMRAKPS